MNIDKFKHQHVEIVSAISSLRRLVRRGIQDNAAEIAEMIIGMSATIRLHLAVEDKVLYPALERSQDPALVRLARQFQDEMTSIALTYLDFARHWNTATTVSLYPERFRKEANSVLRVLHERMQKEDSAFYPAIEAA